MSLIKPLLVELKKDEDSEGIVVDRIVTWEKGEAIVLLGVHWIIAPKGRQFLDAVEYYEPADLTTYRVLDSIADLDADNIHTCPHCKAEFTEADEDEIEDDEVDDRDVEEEDEGEEHA